MNTSSSLKGLKFHIHAKYVLQYPCQLLTTFLFIFNNLRSDAQRAAKQKEAKERELEQCSFSAERIEEGGFPLSMVR